MAFGRKQPKTVSQITSGLKKMLDELEVSQAQFEENQRKADAEIERLNAEKADTEVELAYNAKVSAKFKDLLGG